MKAFFTLLIQYTAHIEEPYSITVLVVPRNRCTILLTWFTMKIAFIIPKKGGQTTFFYKIDYGLLKS